jgi:hypothetical protein
MSMIAGWAYLEWDVGRWKLLLSGWNVRSARQATYKQIMGS